MSEFLGSRNWKMQFKQIISPCAALFLVCCVVTRFPCTDALPTLQKIPTSSQPVPSILPLGSQSDIRAVPEKDVIQEISNLETNSSQDASQKIPGSVLFQRKINVKRKEKEKLKDVDNPTSDVPLALNRGKTLRSQLRPVTSSLKKLWDQLDQRQKIVSSNSTETFKSNTTQVDEQTGDNDFDMLSNFDYSNYYYDDLSLDGNADVAVKTTTIAPEGIQSTSAKLNTKRRPRKLQSRKISGQTISVNRNKFNSRINRNKANTKMSMNVLKEFPIFRQNKSTNGPKFSLHERLKNINRKENLAQIGKSTPSPSTTPKPLLLVSEAKTIPLTTKVDSKDFQVEQPAEETIRTNVTFSTSRSDQSSANVADPYPDILSLALLDEQLGKSPFGQSPFGFAPFGELPQGANPFGSAPEGLSPMGNQSLSLVINQTSEVTGEQGNGEGRYHVQVTAPNGSINGNYVVVDPVTGDLNGVQYEVAENVDPNIVQNALLNFLSLSPLGPPNFPDSPAQSDQEKKTERAELEKGEPLRNQTKTVTRR